MRMTRNRRKLWENAKAHAAYLKKSRPARYTAIAMLGAVGIYLPWASHATVVNVLQDINEDFGYMQGKADDMTALEKAQGYLSQAAKAVGFTQENFMFAVDIKKQAEEALGIAKNNQEQAEENLLKVRKQLQNAKVESTKCTNNAVTCQKAVADYYSVWQDAYNRLESVRAVYRSEEGKAPAPVVTVQNGASAADKEREAAILAEWEKVGFQQNRLSEIEARIGGSLSGGGSEVVEDYSAVDAYWARMDQLSAQVDAAEAEFDAVNDTYEELKDKLKDALEAEQDAREEVAALEKDLAQAKIDVEEAEKDVAESKKDRIEAMEARIEAELDRDDALNDHYEVKQSIEHMGEGDGFSTRVEYYNWHGNTSGHQFYMPYSFYHTDKDVGIGVTIGYLKSHTGLPNGGMSGWTDTTIDVSHLNKNKLYDVRYIFSINMPTGKSRTSENAIVPEHVARLDRMGEGWNFTPRLEVTRHIDKNNSATWRTSYSIRGQYYNSMEDWDSTLNPGNIWSNELEYLRITNHTQFMARMNYLMTGDSTLKGNKYGEGSQFFGKTYYKNWVTAKDAWAAYLIYTSQEAGTNDSSATHRWYYGAGWQHKFDKDHGMRLMFNWMRASGNNYDPIMRRAYLAGKRFSVSAGYDWHIDERSTLSLDLERFVNRNDATSSYRGWQTMLSFNMSF